MKEFDKLIEIIRKLRAPGGCPWDRAQKIDNYKKFLLEEAYELIEEIDNRSPEAIKEELGDLFLILTVIAEMFREKNKFDCQGVLKGINSKLVYRHPHVFSSKKLRTKEEVLKYWIKHKAKKKKRKAVSDRLPRSAPALFLAELFFKEYENVAGNKAKAVGERKILGNIRKNVGLLERAKGSKDAMADILFFLARLAYGRKIDLEGILRKKVISQASLIPYADSQ